LGLGLIGIVGLAYPMIGESLLGWTGGKGERPEGKDRVGGDKPRKAGRQFQSLDELLEHSKGVPRPADLRSPAEYREEVAKSDAGRLCLKFADAVNAGKKLPADLLGPAPSVPAEPVTPEEADRLDAEFILRNLYTITEVRPQPGGPNGAPRFLFVLKGDVKSERLRVRTPEGRIEEGTRSMTSPEVIAEVRDGKIYGVKAQVHVW
jgi:hypothetical protein